MIHKYIKLLKKEHIIKYAHSLGYDLKENEISFIYNKIKNHYQELINNPENIFFKEFFPIYRKNFKNNFIFKGEHSDTIYYKVFFNLTERVIDITNVIIISSDKKYQIKEDENLINKIKKLNINIEEYIKDIAAT